jgi:hypothetical protein
MSAAVKRLRSYPLSRTCDSAATEKDESSESVSIACLVARIFDSGYSGSMAWTILTFGRHRGKTLPQVILSDPDWFFWAVDNDVFQGALATEAVDLEQKATAIKIPKRNPRK